MMNREFKIGDRVIAKVRFYNRECEKRGVVTDITDPHILGMEDLKYFDVMYYYNDIEESLKKGESINYNKGIHTIESLRLDIQYYREEKFKKLLDK